MINGFIEIFWVYLLKTITMEKSDIIKTRLAELNAIFEKAKPRFTSLEQAKEESAIAIKELEKKSQHMAEKLAQIIKKINEEEQG